MSELINEFQHGEFIITIKYNGKSKKFLNKNSNLISIETVDDLAINAVLKLNNIETNVDLGRLHGKLKSYYRIRKGNIRIIFRYEKGEIHIVSIESIDVRGNVY